MAVAPMNPYRSIEAWPKTITQSNQKKMLYKKDERLVIEFCSSFK
jgi:hypothetical protein